MVAFNYSTYVWKQSAVPATPPNKASALAWMESLPAVEAHELLEAGLTTVNIANATPQTPKRMIFVGNITPTNPDGCLTSITGANYQQIPLDTIYIPDPHWPPADGFWQSLASANGGDYKIVQE